VNDSVYGPFKPLDKILENLEQSGADHIGMFYNKHAINNYAPHIQSWFFGVSKTVATSGYFDDFLQNIRHESDKNEIIRKYEVGITEMLQKNGNKSFAFMTTDLTKDDYFYNNPSLAIQQGMPFLKKRVIRKIKNINNIKQFVPETLLRCILIKRSVIWIYSIYKTLIFKTGAVIRELAAGLGNAGAGSRKP